MAKGDKKYYAALHLAEKEYYNHKDVIRILEESVNLGNKKAAYALASWYLNGYHVRKNYRKAFKLLQIAVKNGSENGFVQYKDALYDIAVCYEMGHGTTKDTKLAFSHYLMSAFNGDTQAIEEVSRCLYHGIGVSKDKELSSRLDDYIKSL